MSATVLLEQLLNGLLLGSVYALIAVGFTLVWNILAFINFAHGDIAMVGTFVAVTAMTAAGLPLGLAGIVGVLAGALLGIAVQRFVYRPVLGAPQLNLLIAGIGASIFLQNAAQIVWGASPRRLPSPLLREGFQLGSLYVNWHQVMIFAVAIVLMAALWQFLQRSKWGKAIRACAQDLEAAALMGIDVGRVIALAFALGSGLAVVAGVLIGPLYLVYPTMGGMITLKGFTGSVLGGMGSIPGALLGGLLVGLFEALAVTFAPSGYRDAVAMLVLLLVLLLRPSGLLGQSAGVRP